jgi:hypothetical protein
MGQAAGLLDAPPNGLCLWPAQGNDKISQTESGTDRKTDQQCQLPPTAGYLT